MNEWMGSRDLEAAFPYDNFDDSKLQFTNRNIENLYNWNASVQILNGFSQGDLSSYETWKHA